MGLARIYILLSLVIVVAHGSPAPKIVSSTSQPEAEVEETTEIVEENEESKDGTSDTLDSVEGQLPILPPIILLDFANDLENSSSSDEKSKRTVDSNLGYGFARNNLFTGKYNYYFPAGKSGTSVSIEESISPFLPKTIIETVKPIRPDTSKVSLQNPLQKVNHEYYSQTVGHTTPASLSHRYQHSQIFGQRTKLYKPSQINYNVYQTTGTTPKTVSTTQRPDYRLNSQLLNEKTLGSQSKSNYQSSYSGFSPIGTSPRPYQSYTTPAPSFVTPTSPPYQASYSGGNAYGLSRPGFEATTARPTQQNYSPSESPLASFANLPRFTVENGIRYENKIVWKYPDGKISHSPPSSYVNAYNEFLSKQRPGISPSSYQNVETINHQNPGSVSYQSQTYHVFKTPQQFQSPQISSQVLSRVNPQPSKIPSQPSQSQIRYPQPESRYPAEQSYSNIHSKNPVQFPNDQLSRPSRPNAFVSTASLTNFAASQHQASGAQAQTYQSLQGQFGGKVHGSIELRTTEKPKVLKDSYGSTTYEDPRPVSKYAVDSPDPEYTFPTEKDILKVTTPATYTKLFTPSGSLSPNVLSKYSSQAQKYLSKVFPPGSSEFAEDSNGLPATTPSPPPRLSTNYDDLLNYNPSISQYIRNPSSILNAQPTFIQAGNSLIPVIILRVDGARPIQPKATPNINLKALLQQYLTQYAGNLGQLENPELGGYSEAQNLQQNVPQNVQSPQSPLYELAQLAQSLTQYSPNPAIANNLAKQLDHFGSYDNSFEGKTSYESEDKIDDGNYGRKMNKQKVKSVQIIEDPRFTSYKVNS